MKVWHRQVPFQATGASLVFMLMPFFEPGMFSLALFLLTRRYGINEGFSYALLGDGRTWYGLMNGIIGWTFFYEIVVAFIIAVLVAFVTITEHRVVQNCVVALVGFGLFKGTVRIFCAYLIVFAYCQPGGSNAVDLQWSTAPWIGFGFDLEVLTVICYAILLCYLAVYAFGLHLRFKKHDHGDQR